MRNINGEHQMANGGHEETDKAKLIKALNFKAWEKSHGAALLNISCQSWNLT